MGTCCAHGARRTGAELQAGGQRRGVHDAHVAQQQRAALAHQDQRHRLRGAQALRQDLRSNACLQLSGGKAHCVRCRAAAACLAGAHHDPRQRLRGRRALRQDLWSV